MAPAPRHASTADTARLPAVGVPAALTAAEATIVDMRAPAEFAADHVPGALNVPLFDDAERALVGLLYHRASPERAFEEGLELVLEKIERLVGAIAAAAGRPAPRGDLRARVRELARGGPAEMEERLAPHTIERAPPRAIVVSCWRGGLRSRSVAALLRGLGFEEAVLLEGGYKAYRRHVLAELEAWTAPPAFVLRGLTGVGKTLVLRALEGLRPGWTIDLEAAAGHRSSLLGMVGLEPVSQRSFESRLAARLRTGFPGGVVVYEGESRKVGDAIVPRTLWESLAGGTNVELVAGTERRVAVLVEDYLARESNRPPLREQLSLVEERTQPRLPLVALLDARRDREVVELLLEHYYDPLYLHSERRKAYAFRVDATDPARAAAEIADWIEARASAV